MPLFSIIIATRDRPELFGDALNSVLSQSFEDLEVIVVNDGSAEANGPAYDATLSGARQKFGRDVHYHKLIHRPRGHGQSYSFNYGAAQATGQYIGFLDDDDTWTDPEHLAAAARTLASPANGPNAIDLYMTRQAAFLLDKPQPGPIWLDTLEQELLGRGVSPDAEGIFDVSVGDLMATNGFCHLNTFIIRRDLYETVGGMDEGIRWECDRDIFLRLVDSAKIMKFSPQVISRHNIPDPSKSNNMTTSVSMLEKRLFQVRVLDKAALLSAHPSIRNHGQRHKAFVLKKITEELAENSRYRDAARYAREALGTGPSIKWLAYTMWLSFRSAFSR